MPDKVEIPLDSIICGDSLAVLDSMPENSVDLIVTSPPYNFSMKYDTYDDDRAWPEYFAFLKQMWTKCHRVLMPSGRIAINIQPFFSECMPTNYLIYRDMMEVGFKFKTTILWAKQNHNGGCCYGSYMKSSAPSFFNPWEYIDIYHKGDSWKKDPQDGHEDDITKEEFHKFILAQWDIPPAGGMANNFGHPAMFPEEIPRRLIRLLSAQNDVVLDPFGGCGTTALAACKNHRRFISVDLSPQYSKTAYDRVKSFLDQPDFFEPYVVDIKYIDRQVKKSRDGRK